MRSSPWAASQKPVFDAYKWHEVYAWWPHVVRNKRMGLKVLVWREPIMRRLRPLGQAGGRWQYTIPEWAD